MGEENKELAYTIGDDWDLTVAESAEIYGFELSIDFVKNYLLQNTFELNPTQAKISFPLIKRYFYMLHTGLEPPPIKVAEGAIIDGHHRYLSGHIFNSVPNTIPSVRPHATAIGLWRSVFVDYVDYQPGYDEA